MTLCFVNRAVSLQGWQQKPICSQLRGEFREGEHSLPLQRILDVRARDRMVGRGNAGSEQIILRMEKLK